MTCCLGKRPLNKKLANVALAAGTALFFAAEPAAANDWEGLSIGAGGGYGMTKTKFGTHADDGFTSVGTAHELGGVGGFGTVSAAFAPLVFLARPGVICNDSGRPVAST